MVWRGGGWGGDRDTHSQMDERGQGQGEEDTRAHARAGTLPWGQAREMGLTVDVHLQGVIFAVTRTVGTEAKALYFPCGSGKREAIVRCGSP